MSDSESPPSSPEMTDNPRVDLVNEDTSLPASPNDRLAIKDKLSPDLVEVDEAMTMRISADLESPPVKNKHGIVEERRVTAAAVAGVITNVWPWIHTTKTKLRRPFDERKCLELQDLTSQKNIRVTVFGVYARSLESLAPKVGDVLGIERPTIVPRRKRSSDEGKWALADLFAGLLGREEKCGENPTRLVVFRGPFEEETFSESILPPSASPILTRAKRQQQQQQPNSSDFRAAANMSNWTSVEENSVKPQERSPVRASSTPKRGTSSHKKSPEKRNTEKVVVPVVVTTTVAEERTSKQKADKLNEDDCRVYNHIKDCQSTSGKYNVWAVVARVARKPGPTKGTRIMSQVYITDQDCHETGMPEYQFSLLGMDISHFPSGIDVGTVLRIHHMVVQVWEGSKTGRVYDARSVTAVPGGTNDPIQPRYTCDDKKFTFTVTDTEKVKEMREWFAIKYLGGGKGTGVRCRHLSDVQDETKGELINILIYPLAKLKTRNKREMVLRVTDGTKCNINLARLIEANVKSSDKSATQMEVCSQQPDFSGCPLVDIFIQDHERMIKKLPLKSCVILKGVECVSQTLMAEGFTAQVFKLVINKKSPAGYVQLEVADPRVTSIMTRLRHLGLPPDTQELEIMEHLQNIGEDAPPNSNPSDSQCLGPIVLEGLNGARSKENPKENLGEVVRSTSSEDSVNEEESVVGKRTRSRSSRRSDQGQQSQSVPTKRSASASSSSASSSSPKRRPRKKTVPGKIPDNSSELDVQIYAANDDDGLERLVGEASTQDMSDQVMLARLRKRRKVITVESQNSLASSSQQDNEENCEIEFATCPNSLASSDSEDFLEEEVYGTCPETQSSQN